MEFTVEIYVAPNGKQPFTEWFQTLRDIRTQARVEARLRRLSLGLLGDHRPVGGEQAKAHLADYKERSQ